MITIVHLYHDLLNLYGENKNVDILTKELEDYEEIKVLKLSIDDQLSFKDYDFVYMGAGTEANQKLALAHLLKYKDQVKDYIEDNKILLATGNSFEMFGSYIETLNDKKYPALNIFNYHSKEVNYRIASEVVADTSIVKKPIIGFQNQNSVTNNIDNYLFTFIKGFGSNKDNLSEGINYKNFFGTYIIGPILVRNPHLLIYFIKKLTSKKSLFNLKLETNAYNNFIDKKYSDIIKKP